MSEWESLLRRLAGLYGIETTYIDIWGNHNPVSPETLQALLAAMGVAVETDESGLHSALIGKENSRWMRPLAPVQVVREGTFPIEVHLHLPDPPGCGDSIRWSLTEENGWRHEGEADLAGLQVLERRQIGGGSYARYALRLELSPGWGYHRLAVGCPLSGARAESEMRLIVAPGRCYLPGALHGDGRVWGPAVQLYSLRSRRNWGIGDFTDLRMLVELCAESGANIVGLNPLHALFPHNPEHASPYSPSSRLFRNILYLDVESIPEFRECEEARQAVGAPEFRARLEELRANELVDYRAVSALKFRILEMVYRHFRASRLEADPEGERARGFRGYQAEGGGPLHRLALFQALQEHFHEDDAGVWGWPAWPEAYRDPQSPEVAVFAESHRERVEFFQYVQWETERQYGLAGRRCMEVGLGVGLYEDLALGVDRGGAEAWSNQALYAQGASIGCPPDDCNLYGQSWGLPPLAPERMIEARYDPFIATLRSNMRHAGAIRIDHVMGLLRLFWIPSGKSALDGSYVYYPFEDLLGVLALESHRNGCMVIGEDLGTVPDPVRGAMREYGIFNYRLFYYEKYWDGEKAGSHKPPGEFPAHALVSVGTHDMPTLPGFWTARDLDVRAAHSMFPTLEQYDKQMAARVIDRASILAALEREGLLSCALLEELLRECTALAVDLAVEVGTTPGPDGGSGCNLAAGLSGACGIFGQGGRVRDSLMRDAPVELIQAIYRYAARAPSKVMMVQLEDLLGQVEQINLPGTVLEHPNWRRKFPMNLEDLRGDGRVRELFEALRHERGR